ncbi:Cilia-and flagella-associated protein 20 [Mycena chlorophos]|uniref:Cilia-and flagella-associated protein 20 n=1 Tax=Mycena chlorophos TaxID=658473 RepID=A0A8H6TI21_MYCCL|nr:Cilia-and flagella-associated protein 20 [Mycena chlorophos]
MFLNTVQPETVSLFSSTGSEPLALFSVARDESLPAESFVHLLHDKSSLPAAREPCTAITPPEIQPAADSEEERRGLCLSQTVLHMQSPTLHTTYIRCPSSKASILGLKHPWLHIQARDMGREWSFEVGLVDRLGGTGIVRVSTFQKEPRLTPSNPALLHLPLSFPSISSQPLTTWTTVTLNLPGLLPHFSSPSMYPHGSDFSPAPALGVFSHVSFVKVYATCRLRRIWFNQGGPSKEPPWEFELYGDEYR